MTPADHTVEDVSEAVVEQVRPKPRRLTAEDILAAPDIKSVELEVPEWGGVITLRGLDAQQAMTLADAIKKKESDAPVRLLMASVVDESGDPLFTKDHLLRLQKKSMAAMNRIQLAIMKLNGLGDQAKQLEESAKNA